MNRLQDEDARSYEVVPRFDAKMEPEIDFDLINRAKAEIAKLMRRSNEFNKPEVVSDYLILSLGVEPEEIFGCLFLDARHNLIKDEQIFRGTVDAASVYPRVIVRLAIKHNAAAVIFYHNHPSGNPEPSHDDKRLTDKLVNALKLIDIRALDHLVIGGDRYVSFAERGFI